MSIGQSVELLVMAIAVLAAGGLNRFFEEVSYLNAGLPSPNLVKTKELLNRYGVEMLGPPLSWGSNDFDEK